MLTLFHIFVFFKVSAPQYYSDMSYRFPRDQWDSALQFFLKEQE